MRSTEHHRWLLRNVELYPVGRLLDCVIADGVLATLGPDLTPDPPIDAEHTIDARGGALLPGLADHHLHLLATAAVANSIDVSTLDALADAELPAGPGWLRIVGAHEQLSRVQVDAVLADRPVRVQHRSGALWTLNSAAVSALADGLTADERASGQLWRADQRLRSLLVATGSPSTADLPALGRELAGHGITHVSDASPELDDGALALLRTQLPQHVLTMTAAAGPGPVKIVVADHTVPDLDELIGLVRGAHDAGRPVAIHAVTAMALAICLAVWDAAGTHPGDRIEHAAVCDDAAAARIAELGVTVVTQPGIFARHGKRFLRDSPAAEGPHLWRVGGLIRAGVRVALSSDAPHAATDPWQMISAASGPAARSAERIDAAAALATLLSDPLDPAGPPRMLAAGNPADLCLLAQPLGTALAEATLHGTATVRATFIAGRCVHQCCVHQCCVHQSDAPTDSPRAPRPAHESPGRP